MARKKGKEKPTECTQPFLENGLMAAMRAHYAGKPEGVNKPGHPDFTGKRDEEAAKPFHEMTDFEVEERFRKGVSRTLRDAGFCNEEGKKPPVKGHDEAWAEVYKLHRHILYPTALMNLATTEDHLSYTTSTNARKAMMDMVAEKLGVSRKETFIDGEDAQIDAPTTQIAGIALTQGRDPPQDRQPDSPSSAASQDADYKRFIIKLRRELTYVDGGTNWRSSKFSIKDVEKRLINTVETWLSKINTEPNPDIQDDRQVESSKEGKPLYDMKSLAEGWHKKIIGHQFTSSNPLVDKDSANKNLAFMLVVDAYKYEKGNVAPDNGAAERRLQDYAKELGQQMRESGLIKESNPPLAQLPSRSSLRVVSSANDDGKGGGKGGKNR